MMISRQEGVTFRAHRKPGERLPGGWRCRQMSRAFYGAMYIFPLT